MPLRNQKNLIRVLKNVFSRKIWIFIAYSWGMARIAKKIVGFVLLVLLFEFLSASFFTTPKRFSREGISYDVHQCSLLLPAFLKEEKEKEHFLIHFSRLNIFTLSRNLTAHQNVKNQKIPFHNRLPRFALFCALRI